MGVQAMSLVARPLLVLVSGKPGSGKTTLARRLATEDALWLPQISCDPIRVGMMETQGTANDATGSPTSPRPAVEVFYGTIDYLLGAGVSLIAEISFRRGLDERRLRPLLTDNRLVNIHCQTQTSEAQRRFAAREQIRRPVKSSHTFVAEMERSTFDWSVFEPLDLDLPRLLVDTTDGYAPELAAIVAFCLGAYGREQGECA